MKRLLFVLTFMSLTFPVIWGQTKIQKYAGTAMPYPNRTDSSITFRDGMTPFYINHLGRHGARFPTSRKALDKVEKVLVSAQQENGLTSEGMALLSMIRRLSRLFDGQWGKLSKLGETEQGGIAGRMIRNYPQLFSNSAKIEAIATYVPRSINSMDAFLSCMIRHNPALQVQRSEGKQYNHILRFFDLNKSYVNYKEKGDWLPLVESGEDADSQAEVGRPEECLASFRTELLDFFAVLGHPSGTARYQFHTGFERFHIIAVSYHRIGKLNGHIGRFECFRFEVILIIDVNDADDFMSATTGNLFYLFAHLSVTDQCYFHCFLTYIQNNSRKDKIFITFAAHINVLLTWNIFSTTCGSINYFP